MPQKIEQYKKKIFDAYASTTKIDKLVSIDYKKTDGSFMQIGIRHKFKVSEIEAENIDWHFIFYPMGKSVSMGEINFLIKNILESNAEVIKIDNTNTSNLINEVKKNISNYKAPTLICSVDFKYHEIYKNPNLWGLDFRTGSEINIGSKKIYVNDTTNPLLEKKLIIADLDQNYFFYSNPSPEIAENRLIVDILESAGEYDVTAKVVLKPYLVPQKIVIIELGGNEDGKTSRKQK